MQGEVIGPSVEDRVVRFRHESFNGDVKRSKCLLEELPFAAVESAYEESASAEKKKAARNAEGKGSSCLSRTP